MHEALQRLVRYAFEELDLHRLEADIDPRNEASERTLLRLGFVKEGYMRERWIVADVVSDSAVFGLLRREWTAPVIRRVAAGAMRRPSPPSTTITSSTRS